MKNKNLYFISTAVLEDGSDEPVSLTGRVWAVDELEAERIAQEAWETDADCWIQKIEKEDQETAEQLFDKYPSCFHELFLDYD